MVLNNYEQFKCSCLCFHSYERFIMYNGVLPCTGSRRYCHNINRNIKLEVSAFTTVWDYYKMCIRWF